MPWTPSPCPVKTSKLAYNHSRTSRFFVGTVSLLLVVAGVVFFLPRPIIAGIGDTGVDEANGETVRTNPKSRTVGVSATVRDIEPPTVPILVSPDNGSTTSNNVITFVWKSSSDDYGIAKYQIYLDGNLLFDDLTPPSKTLATKYEYSESSGTSTLVMKYGLEDGNHTWKIRAFDNNGNYSDSATWSFTIDSTAPILIISKIGDEVVSISAQDSSTIPSTPVVLYANEPIVEGKTEANAQVTLSYTIPTGYSGAGTATLQTTADSNGNYSFTLPILPLNAVITLQVTAKDGVGNVSVIDQVQIQIKRKTIPVPAPIQEIFPQLPEEIPVIPPKQVREEIIKTVRPYVPEPVVDIVDTVAPLSNSLVGIAIPLARLFAALWLIGIPVWNWSFRTLLRTANSIGMLPFFWLPPIPYHAEGIVFDVDTQKPIAFALLTALRVLPSGPIEFEQRVSDRDGTYKTLRFPTTGSYVLVPTHHDYVFDPELAKKRFLNVDEVYKGETITGELCKLPNHKLGLEKDDGIECVNDSILTHQYIPMVRKNRPMRDRIILATAKLPDNGLAFSTALMTLIAFLSPSPWNIGVLVVYAAALARRLFTV